MTALRLAAALGLCVAAAVHAEPPPSPAQLRATLVIEPPRIEVGDPFDVELAVVTPPDHAVLPAPVPKAIPGLWILEAGRPSVERQSGRWVHRQHFRARARATGALVWPALDVEVEASDGTKHVVRAPERPFEVSSLLAEHPEQPTFFGYRAPEPAATGAGGILFPALVGALFALAGVALFAWVRHARQAAAAAAAALAALPETPGANATALAALGRASAAVADPVHAADLASAALREWAAERARAPGLRAATWEELAAQRAPFLLVTRWDRFVALVRELDALRFPPPPAGASDLARETIARAAALVGRSA